MRHFLLPTLASAALLAACAKNEPAPEPIRAVRTVTVSTDAAGGVQEYAAEVKARTESRLGFRVGGKLVRRNVEGAYRVRFPRVLGTAFTVGPRRSGMTDEIEVGVKFGRELDPDFPLPLGVRILAHRPLRFCATWET